MAYLGNTIVGGTLKVLNDVNANKVSGDGSGLTSLNASNISSGTLNAARLATSGASAGSYGPSADVSGTNGTTMSVPYITVDAYGRVTSISNKTYTSKDTVYTHPTTAGNKHIPSGGSTGQILKYSASGTAVWAAEYSYTHPTSGATAGSYGPSADVSGTNGTTMSVPYITVDANGHITAIANKTYTSKDTVYTHPTTAGNKHIPSGGSSNQVLVYSSDGTAAWGAVPSHTHSNYLTAHQTIKQDAVTGATGNRFGTCSTAAGTAAKTVSITAGTPTLEAGLRVTVKFANANTAGTPTLNVNSLGAKNIFHKGAQITTGDNKALLAGTCDFVYDGTQFHLVGNYIDTNTVYTHPTTSGNKHIPSGGSSGQILKYSADGTATWAAEYSYTHPTTSGNKHIPSGGSSGQILKWSADGTAAWGAEYSYTHPTTSGNKHIPSGGSSNQVLVYSADGTAAWGAVPSHTHSNYLTAHQTIKQNGVTGATGNCYGACSTAAATAAKTVSITAGTPALEAGLKVTVKFANANTAGTPTLNVNSLGAKNIFHNGAQITTGANKALLAGVCDFVYDGTQFHLVGNYIDTNTQTVTGVKGNSESTYRTGNVNITAANIGAAASNHNHNGTYTPYAASVGSNQKFIYTNSSGVLTAANFEIWVTDT